MAYFQRVNNIQSVHQYITLPPELTVNHPVFVPARYLHNGRYLIGHFDHFSQIGYFLHKNEAKENVVIMITNFGFDLLVGRDNTEWRSHQLGNELNFSDAFVADPLAQEDDLFYYGRCFINNRIFPGMIGTNGRFHGLFYDSAGPSQHEQKEIQILVHKKPNYSAEE